LSTQVTPHSNKTLPLNDAILLNETVPVNDVILRSASARRRISRAAARTLAGQRPTTNDQRRFISASFPPPHLPGTRPALPCHPQAIPRRSSRSIPTRAASAERDLRRSQLSAQSMSPAPTTRQFPPRSGALHSPDPPPAATACQPSEHARPFSPGPPVTQPWRNHQC